MVTFTVVERDPSCRARTGILDLPHGAVRTPQFMPVGTNGTVKAIAHADLEDMGIGLILANTYHLYLRPGVEVIRAAGGLHRFMSWTRNVLTDSGGYQVFSLAPFRKIEPEGVEFRSHIDGARHFLTPEDVVDIQNALGSDVLMTLDVCTPPGIDRDRAIDALRTTSEWARRSKARMSEERSSASGSLFGIVQGNFFKDLRRRSAEEIASLDFPGIAIGGLSVGESFAQFEELLEYTSGFLPPDRPRYLMGVGTPDYLFAAVENGVDLFDCVFPTRIARNGAAFTRRGLVSLKKEARRLEFEPLERSCRCPTCLRYSRAYLRHLYKAKEILAPMLATRHNLHFLNELAREIRLSIQEGRFASFKRQFLSEYSAGEEDGNE